MSIVAFADGTSCSIRGASGNVYVLQENAQSNSSGCVSTSLSNSSDKTINVLVKVYDAYTDQVVKVESVTIFYNRTVKQDFCGLKNNHPYYFRVSEAHCG